MSIFGSFTLVFIALVLFRRSITMRLGSAVFAITVFAAILLLAGYYLIDSFTGSGIDESVLYFLRTGFEGAPIRDFAGYITIAVLLILIAIAVSTYTYRAAHVKKSSWKDSVRALVASGVLIAAFYINPAVTDILSLAQAARSPAQTEIVLGDTPELYAPVDALNFDAGKKNFVLLYLESIERTFLDEVLFPGLMPNLAALEKEALSFTDITQVTGTSHTIAGMVASQCGIPLLGSGAGSDMYLPGATCVGDLLNEAGYDLNYLGGASLEFAGKGTFYQTHGFQSVEGREELLIKLDDPDYHSFWGLYDDSLFAEATKRFDHLSTNDSPFGLVVLTVDTHHPSGDHIPESCDGFVYQDGSNGYLNSVHCADKLAAEFIQHIRSSPEFEDTILIVASDHLARPNQATDILETGERRNLVLAFGADVEPELITKPGNTLDTGPTLLGLVGADTEALGYGRNLMGPAPTLRAGETPVDQILLDDRPFLSTLWSYPQMLDGFAIDSAQNRLVLGDRYAELPALFQLDEELNVASLAYQIEGEAPLISRVILLWYDRRFVWVDRCNRTAIFDPGSASDSEQFCALIGRLGSADTESRVLSDGQQIEYDDLQTYFDGAPATREYYDFHLPEWQRKVQFVDTEVIEFTPPTGLVGDVAIRSVGFPVRESWVLNRETGDRVNLLRGITLLGFNEGEAPVTIAHKDTCAYGREIIDPENYLDGNLLTAIEQNRALYGAMAIVAHSSAVCSGVNPQLGELFFETGLTEWANLSYNQPYIAILSGNDSIQEFVGVPKTALGIELKDFILPVGITQRQLLWLPRVAHAGGNFGNLIYTNSFEALEANAPNYELFEIDFSWTKDGHLVCIHDWRQEFIQSDGLPLTLAEFQVRNEAYPLYDSCALDTLADWIREHDDVRIVMDVKGNIIDAYRMLSEMYPDIQHRFIPQIYQPEDYRALRELGYNDIIWTLYRFDGEVQDVLNWIKHMDLFGLTMEADWVNAGLAREAREETGVLSWVHTINTIEEFDALAQAGAAEIYSDRLVPGKLARFEIASSGYGAGDTVIRDVTNGRSIPLRRGSNLVGLSADLGPVFLARFDGCQKIEINSASTPTAILEALAEQPENYNALAVIVHDSAFCGSVDLETIFAESGLPAWAGVGFREPYIGLIQRNGRVMEFSGPTGTTLREIVAVEITDE